MNENENNNIEKKKKDDLIDPMIVEDDKVFAKKKETWNMIFLLCPNQADALIAAFDEKGPEALSKANITIAYESEETPA